jgi:hypothetical protein
MGQHAVDGCHDLGLDRVAGFIGLAIWAQSVWYGALAAFMLMNCWSGRSTRSLASGKAAAP